jgi:hypothetical protein
MHQPVRRDGRQAHEREPSLEFDAMRGPPTWSGASSRRPASTTDLHPAPASVATLREVLRHAAGLGNCEEADREEWRAGTPPPRRRSGDWRRHRGHGGRPASRRAGSRCRSHRRRPELGNQFSPEIWPGGQRKLRPRVAGAGVEILAPAARRLVRRARAGGAAARSSDRAGAHITATGSIRPLMFERNDLPGVMLCSGAERLVPSTRPAETRGDRTTTDRGLESASA